MPRSSRTPRRRRGLWMRWCGDAIPSVARDPGARVVRLRTAQPTRSLAHARDDWYPFHPMSEPEYLICIQCETPTYQFEWEDEKCVQAVCTACGTDDVSDFMTESELEEQSG